MKRSTIETIVLVAGVIIIGIALFFMFGRSEEDPSQSLFITNLVFSFGFLIYIVYSIMATNSLNREIRALNKHLDGLKHEIEKYKKQVVAKDRQLSEQQEELSKAHNELSENQGLIASQAQKIQDLEKRVADMGSTGANPTT